MTVSGKLGPPWSMSFRIRPGHIDFAEMFAVVNKGSGRILRICRSLEEAVNEARKERQKLGSEEFKDIAAVILDDGGFTEL